MDVSHTAKLANVPLSREEETKFAPQLNATLEFINVINELDTTNTPATAQVIGLTNVLRKDVINVQRILPVEIALSQAHKREGNYFVVPAVIDQS